MIVSHDADPGVRTCSEAWADCLRESGLDVESADLADLHSYATAILVEPHAVLRSVAGDAGYVASLLRRSVCVSTSRFGSGALGADLPFHGAASASLAVSRDASHYLTGLGIPTTQLKPGSHASMRSPSTDSRTVTVGTHARYSSFREDVIARSRGVLDPYACDLRVSHSVLPRPAVHLESAEWRSWLTRVDVLVSLPPESGPGTEWCEVAPAVVNGAVILTTAESDYGPLEPGEDVATATAPGFADSLRRLLGDEERRERMRASALARLSAAPLDATPLAEAVVAVAANRRHARPFIPVSPTHAPEPVEQGPDMAAAIAAAEAARQHRAKSRRGGADLVTVTNGWDPAPSPDISVIIPSYNQAAFARDAIESALAAVGVELEIVVVDDCSTDGSAALVRSILEDNDERPLKLIERADNIGLSGARNHGFGEARAPLVLLLDADDALLPHGPVALFQALQADPDAAFAYGLLARFGLECEDLLGTEPWDPALFRLGNFVPVTGALVRRSKWEQVGGFTAEGLLELGWEDLGFWLRLASAGQHAAHVRRIVAMYRVDGISMSTVTNRHAAALMQFLRERHPDLMCGHDA